MVEKAISKWLENKKNYLYFDDFLQANCEVFFEKISHILFSARIHRKDLAASSCYFFEKLNNHYKIKCEHPSHYKQTFETFNIEKNEFACNKVLQSHYYFIFSQNNPMIIYVNYLKMLQLLEDEIGRKNSYIKTSKGTTFQNIFKIYSKNEVLRLKNDIYLLYSSFDINSKDKFSSYCERLRTEFINKIYFSKNNESLQEFGVFYPFKTYFDFLEKKHYLFEINMFKFLRIDDEIKNRIDDFFNLYEVNKNHYKNKHTPEEYFSHAGETFYKEYAYFNPFELYEDERFKDDFSILLKFLEKKDFNVQNIINELFEIFNMATFGAVCAQQQSLFFYIEASNLGGREFSPKDYIKKVIKNLEKTRDEQQLNLTFNQKEVLFGLKSVLKHMIDTKINKHKNITMKDLNLENTPLPIKEIIEATLKMAQHFTNNDYGVHKLKDSYELNLNSLADRYELEKKHRTFLNSVLEYIFYDGVPIKKNRNINHTMEKILSKYHNLKMDSRINLTQISDLIPWLHDKYCK